MTIPDMIGLVGSVLVIGAYLGSQTGHLPAERIGFPVVNLAGSVLLMISLYHNFNLAAVVIEVFWVAISIYGIVKARGTAQL